MMQLIRWAQPENVISCVCMPFLTEPVLSGADYHHGPFLLGAQLFDG